MDKHKYIDLIEYALTNRRFSVVEACEATGLSEVEFRFVRHQIFVQSAYQESELRSREALDWLLHPQAYFNYLQYCEFKHSLEVAALAQKSAIRANRTAITAIVISVLFGVVTTAISLS